MDAKVLESKKRVATTKGLDQLLSKKSKLNILEKSKHDWGNYVEQTGIEDELKQNQKDGYFFSFLYFSSSFFFFFQFPKFNFLFIYPSLKKRYLDKVAFLQRTEERQFEIERELRKSMKKP